LRQVRKQRGKIQFDANPSHKPPAEVANPLMSLRFTLSASQMSLRCATNASDGLLAPNPRGTFLRKRYFLPQSLTFATSIVKPSRSWG
jgi:hypothetical protein